MEIGLIVDFFGFCLCLWLFRFLLFSMGNKNNYIVFFLLLYVWLYLFLFLSKGRIENVENLIYLNRSFFNMGVNVLVRINCGLVIYIFKIKSLIIFIIV